MITTKEWQMSLLSDFRVCRFFELLLEAAARDEFRFAPTPTVWLEIKPVICSFICLYRLKVGLFECSMPSVDWERSCDLNF